MVFWIVIAVATLKILCTVITLKTIVFNRMGFMVIFSHLEEISNVSLLLSLIVQVPTQCSAVLHTSGLQSCWQGASELGKATLKTSEMRSAGVDSWAIDSWQHSASHACSLLSQREDQELQIYHWFITIIIAFISQTNAETSISNRSIEKAVIHNYLELDRISVISKCTYIDGYSSAWRF